MTDAAIIAEIGKRIKAIRERKKFSQAEVAQRSGLSTFTISQIERGKNSSLSSLIAAMRVLKILDNLDSLAPMPVVSPLELLNQQLKRGKKKND